MDLRVTVRRRIPSTWTPAWRSDAEDEVKATSRLLGTDGSPWGENPLSTVFPVSGMLIDTVIQNADAIHVLLESRVTSTLALDAQARAALEAAVQASGPANMLLCAPRLTCPQP